MDDVTVYMETVYNSSNSTHSTRNLNKNRKKSISIVKTVCVDDWAAKNAIKASNAKRPSSQIHQIKLTFGPTDRNGWLLFLFKISVNLCLIPRVTVNSVLDLVCKQN